MVGSPKELEARLAASSKKIFVLDTNVLLHDPNAIFHFQEHDVVIPIVVIEEIDHFKKDQTEIGRNARTVSRQLDHLREKGSLSVGVKMDGGGTVKVDVAMHPLDLGIPSLDKHHADNHILACAQSLLKSRKEKVVLVTKDSNLRIKADAAGLRGEDYTTDMGEMEELYSGTSTMDVDGAQVDQLFDKGVAPPSDHRLNPNQFVTLQDRANPAIRPWAVSTKPMDSSAPSSDWSRPLESNPATASSSSPWNCPWMIPFRWSRCWARQAQANAIGHRRGPGAGGG